MALPDTLPVASFADLLRVFSATFRQGWQQQKSGTGGGETRYADRAPSLWSVELQTPPMTHAEAEGLMALANSRAGGLKTFLLYNPRLPFPSSDPEGSIIGATVPKLGAITDRLHVAFTGFPAGYVLPLGTFFGIVFDTSRYYLGQFAEAKVANGSGAVSATEIWPPLPASVLGTPDISVSQPPAKFRLVPGTTFASSVSTIHSTISLTAEQTYSR